MAKYMANLAVTPFTWTMIKCLFTDDEASIVEEYTEEKNTGEKSETSRRVMVQVE